MELEEAGEQVQVPVLQEEGEGEEEQEEEQEEVQGECTEEDR